MLWFLSRRPCVSSWGVASLKLPLKQANPPLGCFLSNSFVTVVRKGANLLSLHSPLFTLTLGYPGALHRHSLCKAVGLIPALHNNSNKNTCKWQQMRRGKGAVAVNRCWGLNLPSSLGEQLRPELPCLALRFVGTIYSVPGQWDRAHQRSWLVVALNFLSHLNPFPFSFWEGSWMQPALSVPCPGAVSEISVLLWIVDV